MKSFLMTRGNCYIFDGLAELRSPMGCEKFQLVKRSAVLTSDSQAVKIRVPPCCRRCASELPFSPQQRDFSGAPHTPQLPHRFVNLPSNRLLCSHCHCLRLISEYPFRSFHATTYGYGQLRRKHRTQDKLRQTQHRTRTIPPVTRRYSSNCDQPRQPPQFSQFMTVRPVRFAATMIGKPSADGSTKVMSVIKKSANGSRCRS